MKPNLKVALLPSMLAAALALIACNDGSTANSTKSNEVNNNESMTTDNAVAVDETTNNMSAEEKMINNLTRYRWTLQGATDQDMQPLTALTDIKDQVTLTFNHYQGQDSISYTVGCNIMNAAYQLQGNTLTIDQGMSTKMLCDDLNTAENSLNTLMQGESQLNLAADDITPILTQVTSDDATVEWRGNLTAQAKYNSKGETIFWAVNAKTKPCIEDSQQPCLQVKPISYDDQGIKIDEGEWAEFAGNIDGYQHDGKHDEILRLQRYELNNSDAATDAANEEYAYVLDMVIESAVVN